MAQSTSDAVEHARSNAIVRSRTCVQTYTCHTPPNRHATSACPNARNVIASELRRVEQTPHGRSCTLRSVLSRRGHLRGLSTRCSPLSPTAAAAASAERCCGSTLTKRGVARKAASSTAPERDSAHTRGPPHSRTAPATCMWCSVQADDRPTGRQRRGPNGVMCGVGGWAGQGWVVDEVVVGVPRVVGWRWGSKDRTVE
jgi:hypothetical protein